MSKYMIYPSLLDKFQALLDVDQSVEEFWNIDSEGEYKETADEMSDRLEKELLDAINRVPREPIEAADKGTAFNEVIDCIIENHPCEREDMEIFSSNSFRVLDVYGNPNDPETCDVEHHDECKPNIHVKFNGWDFYFDSFLCKNVARYFRGCIPQYTCSAILPTIYGDVELYGHVDYINTNKVNDLKTTKNYTFGNYEKYWQRHLYPYCLIESGEMQEVTEFEFTIVKWRERKNEPISGEMYKEVYTYNHVQSKVALREICERFIKWLEAHREQITDKKIFAEE